MDLAQDEPFYEHRDLIDALLTGAGLSRVDCRFTYICRHSVAGGNLGYVRDSSEYEQGLKDVKSFITNHKNTLRSIIIIGELGLNSLLGKYNIDNWRGSVVLYDNTIPTVPTYNLYRLKASPGDYAFIQFDFQKARGFLDRAYAPIKYQFLIDPSGYELEEAVNDYSSAEYIANDIETNRGASYIICSGFARSSTEALVIVNHGYPGVTENFRNANERLLNSPAKKIYQNGLFDIAFWNRSGFTVENLFWDTMLGIHVLQPEFPRGLDFLCSIYTDQPYYKGMGREAIPENEKSWSDRVDKNVLYEYNALDCCVTYKVFEEQFKELEDDKRLYNLFRYEMDMVPVSLHLSETGMLYDMERRNQLNKVILSKYQFAQSTLNAITGEVVNVKGQRLKEILYSKDLWNLPVQKKRQKGHESTITADEDAIVKLIGIQTQRVRDLKDGGQAKFKAEMILYGLKLILVIRGLRQLKSNYIDALTHPDNRVRSSWKIAATETGRWASTKFIDGTGLNAQTFPREVIEFDDEDLNRLTQTQFEYLDKELMSGNMKKALKAKEPKKPKKVNTTKKRVSQR